MSFFTHSQSPTQLHPHLVRMHVSEEEFPLVQYTFWFTATRDTEPQTAAKEKISGSILGYDCTSCLK
jgi:hypothetical protein